MKTTQVLEAASIRITPEIKKALREAIRDIGNAESLASRVKINKSNISRYLSGRVSCIDRKNWERLQPVLEPYFDNPVSTLQAVNASDAEFIPAKTPMKKFPVISDAAAAECNTSYMPIAEYATMHAEEEISFSEGKDGDFVIRVTGNSMLPWYPEGTLILVRPYQPLKNGDRVVAILEDGSVTFKCFAEKNDKFYLLSINERDGKDFAFEKSNHSAIRAIYQVIQSMRDERAMDRAMKNAGLHHFWERKLRELE